jgi:hypothetical protein
MTILSTLLQKKLKAKGLGFAQAAKAVGISFPTIRSALLGLRVPNARCVGKFAKFLGISASAVVTAAGPKGRHGKAGASRPATRAVGAVPGRSDRAHAAIIQKLTKLLSTATLQLNALSHSATVIPEKRRAKRVVPKPKAKLPVRGVSRIKARSPAVKVKPKRMSRKPTKKATPPTLPKSVPVKKPW